MILKVGNWHNFQLIGNQKIILWPSHCLEYHAFKQYLQSNCTGIASPLSSVCHTFLNLAICSCHPVFSFPVISDLFKFFQIFLSSSLNFLKFLSNSFKSLDFLFVSFKFFQVFSRSLEFF